MSYTDANGLVWHNGGSETDDHLAFGGHEPNILDLAKSYFPNGGSFLDIGAHVGLYTLNLAPEASVVYAIEANPKTYEVLRENIKNNSDKYDGNVVAVNIAAWDKQDKLALIDENDKATGGSTRCVESKSHGYVEAFPLDDVLPVMFAPDLVKIDVEGAEARVLKGMRSLIVRWEPTFLIEMHDLVYNKPEIREDVLAFLTEVGYEFNAPESLKYGEKCYYLIAKPKTQFEDFEIETVKAGQ